MGSGKDLCQRTDVSKNEIDQKNTPTFHIHKINLILLIVQKGTLVMRSGKDLCERTDDSKNASDKKLKVTHRRYLRDESVIQF